MYRTVLIVAAVAGMRSWRSLFDGRVCSFLWRRTDGAAGAVEMCRRIVLIVAAVVWHAKQGRSARWERVNSRVRQD